MKNPNDKNNLICSKCTFWRKLKPYEIKIKTDSQLGRCHKIKEIKRYDDGVELIIFKSDLPNDVNIKSNKELLDSVSKGCVDVDNKTKFNFGCNKFEKD